MVAVGATDVVGQDKDSQTGRSLRARFVVFELHARNGPFANLFLSQLHPFRLPPPLGGSNGVPEFTKEFPGEPEAIVESLKSGLSYYVVSEWRGIADLSGKRPQLGREAVRSAPKTG